MMINCIEDYDISYNLFLAEQEMFTSLAQIEYNNICNESVNLVALQEGVKETVMNYLQKIMTQIQKIWAKFQSNFSAKVATFLEKKVLPLFDKADKAEFIINNYREYDLSKLDNYVIKPFDYNDQTKDDYSSVSNIINKQFHGLLKEGSTDLKQALTDQISKVIPQYKVTKDIIVKDIYAYCKEGYKENVSSIEKDINSLNNSSKTITSMVSTVMSAQEALELWDNMSLHILTEDKEEKMTFTDTSGETSGEDKKADESKTKITSAVTTYMTASTKLLSAKMSMVNGKFNSCMKILTHFVSFYAKNKTAVVPPKKESTPTEAPTVNTKKK